MEDISKGWRQVRIFTSDFSNSSDWYFNLLRRFALEFSGKYPTSPFWVSKYQCPIQDDPDDTSVPDLKFPFLMANSCTRSLRLRFRPAAAEEEEFLKSLKTNEHWWSDFLLYEPFKDLGNRFCASNDDAERWNRSSILSHVLWANSVFVLDCLKGNSFEVNKKDNNNLLDSSFLPTMHMFNNLYGYADGMALPFGLPLVIDNAGGVQVVHGSQLPIKVAIQNGATLQVVRI